MVHHHHRHHHHHQAILGPTWCLLITHTLYCCHHAITQQTLYKDTFTIHGFLLGESAALLSDNTLLDSRQTGGLPLSLVSSSSPSFAFADDDDGDDDNEDDAEDLGYSN